MVPHLPPSEPLLTIIQHLAPPRVLHDEKSRAQVASSETSLSRSEPTLVEASEVPASRFYRSDISPNLVRQGHKWESPISSPDVLASMKLVSGAERLLWLAPDGTVSAGSLESIVSRAIDESTASSTDNHFKATFLTTYQLFSTSMRLFEMLKNRFVDLHPFDTRSLYSYVDNVFLENRF